MTGDELCSQNIFALHPQTVDGLDKILCQFRKDREGDRKAECYLPTELSGMIREDKITMRLYSTPDKWLGVTNPEDEATVKDQIRKLAELKRV